MDAKETLSKNFGFYYGLIIIFHWNNDLRKAIHPSLHGYQVGMESGAVDFGLTNLGNRDLLIFETASWRLSDLEPEYNSHIQLMKGYGQHATVQYHIVILQLIHNIMGKADNPTILKGQIMDADELESALRKTENVSVLRWLDLARMLIAYLFGDYSNVAKYSDRCKDYRIKHLAGAMNVPRRFLIRGLTAVAISSDAKGPLNKRWKLREARWVLKKMQIMWHRAGNPHFLHMIQLLEAEIESLNRRGNKQKTAESLYKKAIQSAARVRSLNDKALDHELAGRFCLNVLGDTYWAAYQFGNAVESYQEWGAEAKVNDRDMVPLYRRMMMKYPADHQAMSQDLTFEIKKQLSTLIITLQSFPLLCFWMIVHHGWCQSIKDCKFVHSIST